MPVQIVPRDHRLQLAVPPGPKPQQTAQEVRTLSRALAHVEPRAVWQPTDDAAALTYQDTGSPLGVVFELGPSNGETMLLSVGQAFNVLEALGATAVLILQVVLNYLRDDERVTLKVDQLISYLNWHPKSKDEREKMRREVWTVLQSLHRLRVVGRRPGRYGDENGKTLDLRIDDTFICIITQYRTETDGGQPLQQPPVAITLVAGDWWARFRHRSDVLPTIGDLSTILAIPDGRPGGAWARMMALTISQIVRECATKETMRRIGEVKYDTFDLGRTISRRELLATLTPYPSPLELLNSVNPGRAIQYFENAVDLLIEQGIVRSVTSRNSRNLPRRGWQRMWLGDQLDVRPGPKLLPDVREVRTASASARARVRRSLSRPTARSHSSSTGG